MYNNSAVHIVKYCWILTILCSTYSEVLLIPKRDYLAAVQPAALFCKVRSFSACAYLPLLVPTYLCLLTLRCNVLCTIYSVIFCNITLFSIALYYTVLYYIELYYITLFSTVITYIKFFSTVLYYIKMYANTLHSTSILNCHRQNLVLRKTCLKVLVAKHPIFYLASLFYYIPINNY